MVEAPHAVVALATVATLGWSLVAKNVPSEGDLATGLAVSSFGVKFHVFEKRIFLEVVHFFAVKL